MTSSKENIISYYFMIKYGWNILEKLRSVFPSKAVIKKQLLVQMC